MPAMTNKWLLILLLLLAQPTRAQGLDSGRWQGPVRGQGIVSLEIQDNSFTFSFHALTADQRSAKASGSYTVTSKQAATFHVSKVTCVGAFHTDELGGFSFCGWPLRPGMDARAQLRKEGGIVVLEVYDPNSLAPITRFRLEETR